MQYKTKNTCGCEALRNKPKHFSSTHKHHVFLTSSKILLLCVVVMIWEQGLDRCRSWTPARHWPSIYLLRVPACLLIHKPGIPGPYEEVQKTKYRRYIE